MEYLLINHTAPYTDGPAPGSDAFNEMMGAWMAYNQMLIDGGHYIGGAQLAPAETATTLRKAADGSSSTTDGPFAETKEQFSGYYLIEAADLDKALELADQMPIGEGNIEVRPIGFRPDAN